MADNRLHWVAGPLAYDAKVDFRDNRVIALQWLFVGGTAQGGIRRWMLTYNVTSRRLTANARKASHWDRAHSARLAEFFRPMSVLRHDLPRGSVVLALRAMLTEQDLADATALSIRLGQVE